MRIIADTGGIAAARVDTPVLLATDQDYRSVTPLSRHPAFVLAPFDVLLDEHYPHWAREELSRRDIDAVSLQKDWPWLLGASDADVLRAAVAAGRVVVTEDVSTFPAASAAVPAHLGVIYCRWNAFPRTRSGITRLVDALADLAASPPAGLGTSPTVWWLQRTGSPQ